MSRPETVDPHPWRGALAFGLFAIVGGMFASTLLQTMLGHTAWWIPGDGWVSLRAAHYVPQGTYPLIYETGTVHDVFDSGPLLPLLLAPVAAIGDLFHLQESYPFPRAYPSMWLVFGPYALASAVPLMYATRALATRLGIRTGRCALQCAVFAFAFIPAAVLYGHYEDVLALALLMLAFRDLLDGRELRGALVLAAAIGFKQWSVLGVPVYVAACPRSLWRAAASRALIPPALLFSAFLAIDYRWASRALLHPGAFPSLGHSALWVPTSVDYMSSVPSRGGALLVALVGAWFVRGNGKPGPVLSALGVVLLARFLFEPTVHAYYLSPGIAVLMLAEWRFTGARRRVVTNVILASALLLAFPFHPARWQWWTFVYALTAMMLWHPILRVVGAAPAKTSRSIRPISPAPFTHGVQGRYERSR